MTPAEADHLAAVIHRSWPGARHVSLEVWAEELIDQDAGDVATTITRLRRELERPPSIAALRAEVRALTAPAERGKCDICDGTGWLRVADHVVTTNDPEISHRYSQVERCVCNGGKPPAAAPTSAQMEVF